MGKKSRRRNFVKDALDSSANSSAGTLPDLLLKHMSNLPGPNDPGAIADFVKPDPVNESSLQATKLLPRSNEVWFADYHIKATDEGLDVTIMINLVEKEHKSNGAILPKSDGLSHIMGTCYVLMPSDASIIPSLLVGTIIKTCRKPCVESLTMNVPPHRPRKLMFRSAGIMNAVACDIEEMGIEEAGVAEAGLVESVQSYIVLQDRNSMMSATTDPHHDPMKLIAAKIQQDLQSRYCDENEDRVPLANWTEHAKSMIGAVPIEWFVKPPPANGSNFRMNQLWGWRSNLETACKIGDESKIVELATKHPASDVRSFCEQRCLLTRAADTGMLNVCKALLKHCHCHPDGVQSPTNKVEWEAEQHESGSRYSYTPLLFAAREGHKKIVQLLIKHGANLNLIDTGGPEATALHCAAFGGHQNICKYLLEAGADRSIQDRAGDNPITTARSVLLNDHSKKLHVATVMEIAKYDVEGKICGACGAGAALRKCPCGFQVYCDKECQSSMWKIHRTEHNLHLSGKM